MIGRRTLIASAPGATLAWPLPARAQQSAMKRPTIGFLHPGPASVAPPRIALMREGLRSVGYRESDQIEFVVRTAENVSDRLGPMAADLVGRRVDVIVPVSPSALRAVRSASAPMAIVAHDLETDPQASGMAASLARPGGNVTGVFLDFAEFAKKWLELLKEAIPHLSSVAVLWDPATGRVQLSAVEAASKVLDLNLEVIETRGVTDLDSAIRSAVRHRALLLLSSPLVGANAEQIAKLTLDHRLPAMTLFPDFARSGGLMAYGPHLPDTFRQLGAMLGKVLLGTRPADLPIQRPAKFELVVNLRSAQVLGIDIPRSILARADELIE